MDKVISSFNKARRSNFVPSLLLLISLYLLYFSVKDYTVIGIIICSLFILSTVYILFMNIRYNMYLRKMLTKVDDDVDYVLDEMTKLLDKVDNNNKGFKGNIQGAFVGGPLRQAASNELHKNFEKRKKIASVVYSLTLYKKNNIKL